MIEAFQKNLDGYYLSFPEYESEIKRQLLSLGCIIQEKVRYSKSDYIVYNEFIEVSFENTSFFVRPWNEFLGDDGCFFLSEDFKFVIKNINKFYKENSYNYLFVGYNGDTYMISYIELLKILREMKYGDQS